MSRASVQPVVKQQRLDRMRWVAGAGAGADLAGDRRRHRGGVPHQPLPRQRALQDTLRDAPARTAPRCFPPSSPSSCACPPARPPASMYKAWHAQLPSHARGMGAGLGMPTLRHCDCEHVSMSPSIPVMARGRPVARIAAGGPWQGGRPLWCRWRWGARGRRRKWTRPTSPPPAPPSRPPRPP